MPERHPRFVFRPSRSCRETRATTRLRERPAGGALRGLPTGRAEARRRAATAQTAELCRSRAAAAAGRAAALRRGARLIFSSMVYIVERACCGARLVGMLLGGGRAVGNFFGCFACDAGCRCPKDGSGGLRRALGGRGGGRAAPSPAGSAFKRVEFDTKAVGHSVKRHDFAYLIYTWVHFQSLVLSRRAVEEICLLVCSAEHGSSRAILAVRRATVGPP